MTEETPRGGRRVSWPEPMTRNEADALGEPFPVAATSEAWDDRPVLRTIVEGEPGIFPDPVARIMRGIGGLFRRKPSADDPTPEPTPDASADPSPEPPAAGDPGEGDRPDQSGAAR